MLKKMNFPNKLTMLRIVLVPIFIILLSIPQEVYIKEGLTSNSALSSTTTTTVSPARAIVGYVALLVFAIAAITDALDGKISRSRGIVTKFGKIMDPLADKLLVSAGFIMLTGLDIVPAYITALVVFRDFFVTALRMFGSDNSKDVAAGLSGKVKTLFQMIAIFFSLLNYIIIPQYGMFAFIENSMSMVIGELLINVMMSITLLGTVVATIWSFVDYFLRFKEDIDVEN